MEGISIADALALTGTKENSDFSFGGVGGLILILLFFIIFGGAWGGYGFGRNNDNHALSDLERDVLNGNCTTQKAVMQSQYDTLLGFKDAQYQLSSCCCNIEKTILEDGARTRQLILDNNIQELRDRLNTANNALTTQTIINQVVEQIKPCPVPAYLVCGGSPYGSYYSYGFNNGCNGNF